MAQCYPEKWSQAKDHTYSFWKNKPVSNFNDIITKSEIIEEQLDTRAVYSSDESCVLPSVMKWKEIDVNNSDEMNKIVKFLNNNYLVSKSNKFMLEYSESIIKWSIGQKGRLLAIVTKSNEIICGVISSTVKNMTVFDKKQDFVSFDFLCAHPKYRGKKMAYVLIDECIRRSVKDGCGYNAGFFTSSKCVPTPTTIMRFYHRPLNYPKLFRLEFTQLENGRQETINKFDKLFTIVDNQPNSKFVLMTNDQIEEALKLYNSWMSRFNIYCNYDEQSFKETFLNNHFVKTYAILNENCQMIDFVSFYLLNYSVANSTEHIYGGYLFNYTANTITTNDIIKNVLNICAHINLDVFNTTDIMTIGDTLLTHETNIDEDSDDESVNKMYEHKFLKGSGKLHFNFFNWKCPRIPSKQINWVTI